MVHHWNSIHSLLRNITTQNKCTGSPKYGSTQYQQYFIIGIKQINNRTLDFKLSPCSVCCMLSFG